MDMRNNPGSIFNESLGPIFMGPSSSHTAGPCRISRFCRMLLGEDVKDADFYFGRNGSYATTYHAHKSDRGFCGGLMGWHESDPRQKEAIELIRRSGARVSFHVVDDMHEHPNFARLAVVGKSGARLEVDSLSTGGGTIEILAIDGFAVKVHGEYKDSFIETKPDAAQAVESALSGMADIRYQKVEKENSDAILYIVSRIDDKHLPALDTLKNMPGVIRIRHTDQVLPVCGQFSYGIPFFTAAEALAYSEESGDDLAELGIIYEMARSGKSRQELMDMMATVVRVMREASDISTTRDEEVIINGYFPAKASEMARNLNNRRIVDLGILNKSMVLGLGVCEHCNMGEPTVAAPTGGSSGIIAATVILLGQEMGISDEELIKAMFVPGLVGVFVFHLATFAAEVGGCQAEVTFSAAMAAAGVAYLLGGSVGQCFAAASQACQNLHGLICDPINGSTYLPCASRNCIGVADALVSANMVLLGYEPYIPLDEMIASLYETGKLLPHELRCTGYGGMATTPTAQKLTKILTQK